jgi:hypothetical protein
MTKSFGPIRCGGSLVEWDKTGKGPKGEQGLAGLPLGRNASRTASDPQGGTTIRGLLGPPGPQSPCNRTPAVIRRQGNN